MNHFAISLSRDILVPFSKPWGSGVNPLVLIGLTEAILELGLSEQELHAAVRSYARQLSAQVHPDRGHGHSQSQQKEIIGAFDAIQDLELFRVCLAEFKNTRAEERHEINLLRSEVRSLRKNFRGIEDQHKAISVEREELRAQRQRDLEEVRAAAEHAHEQVREETKELEDYKRRYRQRIEAQLRREQEFARKRESSGATPQWTKAQEDLLVLTTPAAQPCCFDCGLWISTALMRLWKVFDKDIKARVERWICCACLKRRGVS